jgi:branched-chain amino acid transport system ATP-binding protein
MLEVSDLHAHYGRAHILHGVSLSVREGEVLALLGRNGAGKSTTMKAIMGVVRPTSGVVRLDGRELAGRESFEIARAGLGYVPEERRIFTELTVAENLEVGRKAASEGRAAWTPERLFDLFPSLGTMRTRAGGRMSGGEQQMLTIARTLMGNPRLLLLDEPSEGLAPCHHRADGRGDPPAEARGAVRAAERAEPPFRAAGERPRLRAGKGRDPLGRWDGGADGGRGCAGAVSDTMMLDVRRNKTKTSHRDHQLPGQAHGGCFPRSEAQALSG